jgi:hypothetical protein
MNNLQSRSTWSLSRLFLVGASALSALLLSGCAAQKYQSRVQLIESAPPAECESISEVQGRGGTDSDAMAEALRYADDTGTVTHVRITDHKTQAATATYSGGWYVVIGTMYRCPPGLKVNPSR